MRKKIFLLVGVWMFLFYGICLADAPHQVGGFVLNRNIAEFKDYVLMETALPIRYMENIEEVETKSIEGFKSGLIAYGTCKAPGHIVRIKLKYSDPSKKFYEQLLKRIKQSYGEPNEYIGDPFHIVVGWKWSFVDKDNNRISLNLQHNERDEEAKMGNSIKLTMTNLMEEDRLCYAKKDSSQREQLREHQGQKLNPGGLSGWSLFVPR